MLSSEHLAYTTPRVMGTVRLFESEGFPHCADVSFSLHSELSEAARLVTLESQAFEGSVN